jgi:MYXO-CTERM domain-containing protein
MSMTFSWRSVKAGQFSFLMTAASLGLFLNGHASADLVAVSESRSDSASASGTYSAPQSVSNSSSTDGDFTDTQMATSIGSSPNEPASNSAISQGLQSTSISSAMMQGSGSANTSATLNPGSPEDGTEAAGSASFLVSFTVPNPEIFTLTGTLTGSTAGHEGTPTNMFTNVEFSSPGDPGSFFELSEGNKSMMSEAASWSVPFSFSTTLEAGPTYTLSLTASIDTGEINDISRMDMSSDSFNFVAVVPEPTAFTLLGIAGLGTLRRRRR